LLFVGVSAWPAHAAAAEATKKGSVEPAAIRAIQAMGTFLRTLNTMEVQSEMTTDDILPTGQKVQLGGTVSLKVKRPDRLRVEIASDRKNERIFYDGRAFTVFQPQLGYFATFAAPHSLGELVDVLEQQYGLDLPLADLFRLGTDPKQLAAIKDATVVGSSTVRGTPCVHYAFHQTDIDWEIWIEQGERPLPRKMVITTRTEKTQPQHTSVMTWNLKPAIDEQVFAFVPPPNAQRIDFDVAAQAGAVRRQGRAPGGRLGGKP
jgi:hypothetical protein